MTNVPVLESDRLRLRAHTARDYPSVASMWADPVVVKFITGVPSTPSESWSRVLRYAGLWQLLGYGYWLVESREDSRFLGEVGFADFKRGVDTSMDNVPEAGWVFKTSESGCGYASEAVNRMLVWADEVANFSKTVCLFDPEHSASLNVARKVGYAEPAHIELSSGPALLMWRDSPIDH
ncbi:MAG: GNAT family N-acetyltransferase [Granulosicoccus sp.]